MSPHPRVIADRCRMRSWGLLGRNGRAIHLMALRCRDSSRRRHGGRSGRHWTTTPVKGDIWVADASRDRSAALLLLAPPSVQGCSGDRARREARHAKHLRHSIACQNRFVGLVLFNVSYFGPTSHFSAARQCYKYIMTGWLHFFYL